MRCKWLTRGTQSQKNNAGTLAQIQQSTLIRMAAQRVKLDIKKNEYPLQLMIFPSTDAFPQTCMPKLNLGSLFSDLCFVISSPVRDPLQNKIRQVEELTMTNVFHHSREQRC